MDEVLLHAAEFVLRHVGVFQKSLGRKAMDDEGRDLPTEWK